MKKMLVVCAVVAALFAGQMPASASTGAIAIGHPAAALLLGGITENGAPCDIESDLNGVDGVWYDLASLGSGSNITVTPAATLDAGMSFFNNDNCGYISSEDTNFLGAADTAAIPAGAAHVIVYGFAGSGTFELTRS